MDFQTSVEAADQAEFDLLRRENEHLRSELAHAREESVRLRTDAAHNRDLQLQLLRAQRLESVGSLASGIAHDLNNVLTPILMSVSLLDDEITDPQSRRLLTVLEESAQRGATMVRQILAFSRGIDRPRSVLDPRQVLEDLRRLIAETFPRWIELVVEAAPGVTEVKADPTQIHQVLLNLCLNARDAMAAGGRLTLRAEAIEIDQAYAAMADGALAGRYIVFNVSDTGCGMPADVRSRAFEPFFTTKSAGQSTGLGLSTAQSVVRAHSGFLTLHSQPGRGTTVQIFLPAFPPTESDGQQALPVVPRGRDELILVVDDEASVRSITEQVLTAYGYRVVTASNGAEAVAEFARHPNEFAAVLTDMMMPVMDGACTMRALRTIEPDVRLIAATGMDTGFTGLDSIPNVAAHLAKPYRAEALLQTVRRVLDA